MVTRDAVIYGCQVKILPHGTFYHSTYIVGEFVHCGTVVMVLWWGVVPQPYIHTYYVKAIVKFTADDS